MDAPQIGTRVEIIKTNQTFSELIPLGTKGTVVRDDRWIADIKIKMDDQIPLFKTWDNILFLTFSMFNDCCRVISENETRSPSISKETRCPTSKKRDDIFRSIFS